MKTIIFVLFTVLLASCSSTPLSRQERINEHLSQGIKFVDGDFDSKFEKDGSDGMYLRRVGTSIYPMGYNEQVIRAAAVADAKFKLVSAAPSEMKIMVQKAIGNSMGYVGEFNQIETSITEVYGLKGIEVSENDIQCKIQVTPTIDMGYRTERICKSIARVLLTDLAKAFDFTMDKKYDIKKKSDIQKVLNQQLEQNLLLKQPENLGRRVGSIKE